VGSPPDQRPAALLLTAGVVAVDGAALLGFAGWARAPPYQPGGEQSRCVPRRDHVHLADGSARALAVETLGLRCRRFPSAVGLGVTYEMASDGFWPGAMLLGLADVAALLALFSAPARAALGRSHI